VGFPGDATVRRIADVTITIDTASVDEGGRFVHADDAVAQLCLALVRLEAELTARGLGLSDVVRMRVLAVDPNEAAELADLALERFQPIGAAPEIRCLHVGRMTSPGMLVALSADVTDTTLDREPDESDHEPKD
jgi:enamine deaminase RidA (YjgF/YER057c/UK114 family)